MTAIALQSLNYSGKLLSKLLRGIKLTFQGVLIGFMISRQTAANQHVARQLCEIGEYRQDEYWTVLADLNRKCIQSIHKEFSI